MPCEAGSAIIGISGLLTTSFESMKQTVQALEAAGLRESVKVIVGGGIVTEMVLKYVGATRSPMMRRRALRYAEDSHWVVCHKGAIMMS